MRHWAAGIGARYGRRPQRGVGARNGVPGELLVRLHAERVVAEAGVAD